MEIKLKRAYAAPAKSDGRRILVERLWPRGLTKDALALDEWFKDIAPSPELRKWYAHDAKKWPAFQKRYRNELDANLSEVERLRGFCARGVTTFVFAAKDELRNSALVLKAYLEDGN